MALVLFWASVAVLAWISFGYAAVVAVYGALRRRPVQRGDVTPSVTVLVAAHDEEASIAGKIRNTLSLDYPPDRLEIVVASDGSTDRTEEIVRGLAGERVRLLSLPRRGKVHTLHDAALAARGEVLVFTDANTRLDRAALRKLVRNFADPDVGGVCGNQRVRLEGHEESSADGERLYWGYDKRLKALESDTGSIVSADGAIYAIRRELYREPASPAVNDDFAISTKVVELGKRLVFEGEALAWEAAYATAGHEFERKVRILTKGLWSVVAARGLLNPFRYGFYSCVLLTHKVLRRLTPLFLAGVLVGSVWLAGQGQGSVYRSAVWLQLAFFAFAAIGGIARGTKFGKSRLFGAPFFFCLTMAAALVGLGRVVRGKKIEGWQPRRRDVIA